MKVSVWMITYNHDRYIAQAIDSVLMQRVNFDYELVIGEDCSTDRTREIVLEYQKRYPGRIHLVLPEKNVGPFWNFFQTFQACRGEYLACLEGDDYWTSPQKLQKQVDYMDIHPECTLCHHNVIELYENGSREPHPHHLQDQKQVSTLEDLWEMNFIASCSTMLRRHPVQNIPKWFINLPWTDWGLFVLAAQKGNIGYLNEMMGVHRVHAAGTWSGSDNIQRHSWVVNFYKAMDKGLDLTYHERIRPRLAEEYYHLALEYERKSNLASARKCTVRSFFEDPHCRRVPRRDLYKAITRIHKAILKLHAPTLYRALAAIRKVLPHRDLPRNGTEGSVLSGKHDARL
jgi:glycosyltransferase involved in cell wall biosynthesis